MAICSPFSSLAFLSHTDGSSARNRIVQSAGAGDGSFFSAGAWPHAGATADKIKRPAHLMEVGICFPLGSGTTDLGRCGTILSCTFRGLSNVGRRGASVTRGRPGPV